MGATVTKVVQVDTRTVCDEEQDMSSRTQNSRHMVTVHFPLMYNHVSGFKSSLSALVPPCASSAMMIP